MLTRKYLIRQVRLLNTELALQLSHQKQKQAVNCIRSLSCHCIADDRLQIRLICPSTESGQIGLKSRVLLKGNAALLLRQKPITASQLWNPNFLPFRTASTSELGSCSTDPAPLLSSMADAVPDIPLDVHPLITGLGQSMWPPANWLGYGLNFAHDYLGWKWGTIIMASVAVWRLATFPILMSSGKTTHAIEKAKPELNEIGHRLEKAGMENDRRARIHAIQNAKRCMQKHSIRVGFQISLSVVQLLMFGTFFMCLGQFSKGPIKKFKDEGIGSYKDLTKPPLNRNDWFEILCLPSVVGFSVFVSSRLALRPRDFIYPRIFAGLSFAASLFLQPAVLIFWATSNMMGCFCRLCIQFAPFVRPLMYHLSEVWKGRNVVRRNDSFKTASAAHQISHGREGKIAAPSSQYTLKSSGNKEGSVSPPRLTYEVKKQQELQNEFAYEKARRIRRSAAANRKKSNA